MVDVERLVMRRVPTRWIQIKLGASCSDGRSMDDAERQCAHWPVKVGWSCLVKVTRGESANRLDIY